VLLAACRLLAMPDFAMKIYDLQWFTTYGMDYQQAAEALRADGIDTVLTGNRIDPLPSSGVDQTSYLEAYGSRLATYSDQAWVQALKEAGLTVFQTTATFFDPAALEQFPDARPINALGEPDTGFDWYTGICPTHDDYQDRKYERLAQVAEELQPDGFFLQFFRFPGFWENWTWNPDYQFSDRDLWCFCDRCRSLFAVSIGASLPSGDQPPGTHEILDHLAEFWNQWRCRRIFHLMGRLRRKIGANDRGTTMMLNTLPFPASDFGGIDVRRTIAGQDLSLLRDVVDRFELMTYLQILNRPLSWLAESVEDARRQVGDSSEIVCTLQVAPLYTSGIHADRNRRKTISSQDLVDAASTALEAGADGLVFYHWTDFLDDEAAGGDKRKALREITNAEKAGA
jgi:hypothetical protein